MPRPSPNDGTLRLPNDDDDDDNLLSSNNNVSYCLMVRVTLPSFSPLLVHS